jgi:glycosyltransferase involved in cell wall biosynthesis
MNEHIGSDSCLIGLSGCRNGLCLVRILYLHPAATFGGASKSLIELFCVMRQYGIEGTVLTPAGSAARAFTDAGMEVVSVRGLSQFDNTRYGHYRGLRWIILLRELSFLPGSLLTIWHMRKEQFDILHVNEVTLLPLAIVAKKLFKKPMVVHVRSLQCPQPGGLRNRIINRWLARHADAVIPIDHTVASTLDHDLTVDIVHNGLRVDADHFADEKSPQMIGQAVRVGFMGVLIALKGIYELVEAMHILKKRCVAIECIIVGENARNIRGIRAWALRKLGFARNVREDLEQMIRDYGLEKHIRLLGFVKDVRTVYPTFDIICFPSHLNAAGRPVFEAALYSIPSVVAVKAPFPDAVLHEQTGLAIPKPDPELIADALQRLAQDGTLRLTLGRQARKWAVDNFSINNSADAMMAIYNRLVPIRSGRN